MKKFIFSAIIAAGCLMQHGCVPLVSYPAYTHDDVVYDPNLLGQWVGNAGMGGEMVAEFKPASLPNIYTLSLKWQNKEGTARAVLFKLDNNLFLDIAPEDSNDVFADLIVIPAHLVVRIDKISPQFQFAPMSQTNLTNIIAADPAAVENHNFGEKMMLTCSTRMLQKFLRRHAKSNLFEPVITLKPVKNTAPAAAVPDANNAGTQKH